MPPVGPLRFKAPQPAPRTRTVINAFSFANAPIQPDRIQAGTGRRFIGDVNQSEDCLYLNIWTPDTPGPHPVFVWIYGGSNIYGATSQPLYDGTSFARSGVVCVTIGYRLGALGFLELGAILGDAYNGSGNNALRDQVLALTWVRDNISAFGGDHDKVTIAGESAGGKNLSALLAAPAAKGLFQQAIVQSGGALTTHTQKDAQEVAGIFASALQQQAPGTPVAQLLLNTDAAALLKAQVKTVEQYQRNFAFRTVIDRDFMPRSPQALIADGASSDVPLLIGSNRDEALLFFPPALLAAHRQNTYSAAAISSREMAQIDPATMQQADDLYQKAFPSQSAFDRRLRLLTAEEYWIPTIRVADAHAANGGKTYLYRFDESARQGPFSGYAVHAGEQPFTWRNFGEPFLEMLYGRNPPTPAFADVVHQTWVSFIKTGTPSHPQLPTWPRYSPQGRRTMILDGAGSTIQTDPAGQERELWNRVMP